MLNTPDTMTERQVFTVGQLNQTVRALLEKTVGRIWIKGELSNVAQPRSGHLYFTLKDEKAQVRCAFFKGQQRSLGFTPQEGMAVMVQAAVSLYEPRGDYQLIVSQMEQAGLGQLQQAYEALKAKLKEAGLFDLAHKKPLPRYPKHIGIITSQTAAALQDILSVLKRRYPIAPITVYPTQVQGKPAAKNIVAAITTANEQKKADILILTRGGGSLEDLWCFNEEIVAQSIYASELPIITGIGHEIDFTIADFVADVRAPTPSAAAETVAPDTLALAATLKQHEDQLTLSIKRKIRTLSQQIDHLEKRLKHPGQIIKEAQLHCQHLTKRLILLMQQHHAQWQQRLSFLAGKLDTLSPLATLGRGYAIVSNQETQTVVQTIEQLAVGERLKTRLKTGSFESTVTALVPDS